MASSLADDPKLQVQRCRALVRQKSTQWDLDRLRELYCDLDPQFVNAEPCLKQFLDENRVLFTVKYVDCCPLVIELNTFGVLSNGEKDYYCSPVALNADSRALRFNEFTQRLTDIAKFPRNNVITHLYLALRNTYEESTGGRCDNHYHLARSLRNIVHYFLNVRKNDQDLATVVNRIESDEQYDVKKGIRLMEELKVSLDNPESLDYRKICQCWFKSRKHHPSLHVLVCGLIRSGLGKLASCLQPCCNSNPPDVLKVLRQLPKPEESWIDFAHLMGYSDDDPEIRAIISNVPPAVRLQIFLRICQIPDCGVMTVQVVDCLQENPLFGGQVRRQQSDIPQGQPMLPVLCKPSPPSKPTAGEVSAKPPEALPPYYFEETPGEVSEKAASVVQHYRFNEGDGARFLDNCIFDHWRDVDAVLELSNTELPPEVTDDDGKTAFINVCTKERVDIQRIRKMIERGANLTHTDKNGYCVLHYNCVLRNRELLELLLMSFKKKQLPIDIPTLGNAFTPLMMACMLGNDTWQSAELLLRYEASPDGSPEAYSCPLMVATDGNSIRLVESLIKAKVNVNRQDNDGKTALLTACRARRWNIAHKLINQPNIDLEKCDCSGTTPLFAAISENSYDITDLLLRKGADLNRVRIITNPLLAGFVEETPLAHACARGFLDIVKLLLSHKADVNFKCSDSVPAIGYAIILKQNFIVKYLLDHCSELNTTIYGLMAPINISVKVENFECTKMMLDKVGGLDRAIQVASSNALVELEHHLRTFAAFVEPDFGVHSSQSGSQSRHRVQSDHDSQQDQIFLKEFSEICITAIRDKSSKGLGSSFSELVSVAEAIATQMISNFLQRCATYSQSVQSLTDDFLTVDQNMSPLSFLISSGALTLDDFHKYSKEYFRISDDAGIQTFYKSLVAAFRNIPGNESLPQDDLKSLEKLFSRQFVLKYKSGNSQVGQLESSMPTQDVPEFPGPGYTLGSRPSESSSNVIQSSANQQTPELSEQFSGRRTPSSTPKSTPVLLPPKIMKHPRGRSMIYGEDITLEISASGSDLNYTWFKDGIEITVESFPQFDGIRTNCLNIKDFLPEHAGKYLCKVSNSLGETESWNAELTLGGNILTSLEVSALRRYLSDKVAVDFLNKLFEYRDQNTTLQEVQNSLRRIGLVSYADELRSNLESEVKNISEELLSKAMDEGFVECRSGILLLVGVAGAGKSSFKRMLFEDNKENLQVERNSTPLAEAAIRAVSTPPDEAAIREVSTTVASVDDETDAVVWKKFTSDSLRELLATYTLRKPQNDPPTPITTTPHVKDSLFSQEERSTTYTVGQTVETPYVSSLSSIAIEVDEATKQQPVSMRFEETETYRQPLHENLRTKKAVIKICEHIIRMGSFKDIRGQTWIYVIDSGGQPQFQELLPLFVKNASAVAFFVKLNERLDYYPSVEYFSKGIKRGEPYRYSLTHREVLENSLHTVQSRKRANESDVQECPSLLFVGTFLDKLNDCNEDIKSKNASIKEMLIQAKWCRQSLVSYYPKDPLFCVNAQNPDKEDFEVAMKFRRSVTKKFNDSKPFKVPIKWFLFEQILQEMSIVNGSFVFSMGQCKEIASWLHIDADNLLVALDYLARHNVVSWFQNILPDVIFTSAQVILDKLSELVECSYIFCNNIPEDALHAYYREMYCMEGIWHDFQHYGYISVSILNRFQDHYNEVFTPSKLLTLWVELLVVAKDSEGHYFMPCILRDLPKEEVHSYRIKDISPLLFCYEKQFFPTGIFSCLISYLSNISGWNILKEDDIPKCFYKNCVQFIYKTITITLIYSPNYVEVYPLWGIPMSYADCQRDCSLICTTIEEGLLKAAKVQNYDHLSPKFGILCPANHKASTRPHVAFKCAHHETHWQCTIVQNLFGKLTQLHLLWFPSESMPDRSKDTSSLLSPQRVLPQSKSDQAKPDGNDAYLTMIKCAEVLHEGSVQAEPKKSSDQSMSVNFESQYSEERDDSKSICQVLLVSEDDAAVQSLLTKSGSQCSPQVPDDHTSSSSLAQAVPTKSISLESQSLRKIIPKADSEVVPESDPISIIQVLDRSVVADSASTHFHGSHQDSEESSYVSAQFVQTKSVSFESQSSEERYYGKSISHESDSGIDSLSLNARSDKVSQLSKQTPEKQLKAIQETAHASSESIIQQSMRSIIRDPLIKLGHSTSLENQPVSTQSEGAATAAETGSSLPIADSSTDENT